MSYTNGSGLTIAEVAAELMQRLGIRMVAILGAARSTRIAELWTQGVGQPAREAPLRAALTAARTIAAAADDASALSWFMVRNEALGMRAPIDVLRDANNDADYAQVITVAIADVA